MKRLLLTLLLATSYQTQAADIGYVSDEFRVPVRSTPCNSCKIIHHGLKSGTRFEIIEKNSEGWSHIVTSAGTEGWIPSQYVATQKIAKLRIQQIEKQSAALQEDNLKLTKKLQELESAFSSTQTELTQFSDEKTKLNEDYIELQRISDNSVNIHQQNQELLKENSILQNDVDFLTNANDRLENNQDLKWFAYGAGAVLAGILIALVLPNLKRKRRFSEWG